MASRRKLLVKVLRYATVIPAMMLLISALLRIAHVYATGTYNPKDECAL